MSLDAMFVAGLKDELSRALEGARIDKIHQPERDEIVLAVRGAKAPGRLLISANPGKARVCGLDGMRENPPNAPMFCMLLRKHLTGGRIRRVSQPGLERILDFEIDVMDELGLPATKTLTAELMGRHSNIILRDGKNMIIDALKRIDIAMSEKRQVLPGLIYDLPPKQNKLSPFDYKRADIFEMLCGAKKDESVEKWLLDTFFGVSPLICREIAYRAAGDTTIGLSRLTDSERERVAAEAENIFTAVKSGGFKPCILYDGDKPADFSFVPITQYGGMYRLKVYEDMSCLLRDFYDIRDEKDRLQKKAREVMKTVNTAYERANRKLELQRQELADARNREEIRKKADIITANLYRMEKGMSRIRAQDFFSPDGGEIEIPLDISLTPQQNAAVLYKKYNRMKNAEMYLTEQISRGECEVEYLDSVKESLERAETVSDIDEIREELAETGYIKKASRSRKKEHAVNPFEFKSSDGYRIYAGRNNRQNELLTLKIAFKEDMWLHAQKIPGSHVIIECAGKEPPPRTVTEAAVIAAYFSRARESRKVPVDFTKVRFVKKIPGGKPGAVSYTNQKTAFADPDEALVERLRVSRT